MSTTRRAFCGVMRTKRALAKAPGSSPSRLSRRALCRRRSPVAVPWAVMLIVVSSPCCSGCGPCWAGLSCRGAASAAAALAVFLDVSAVGSGRRELAELVTDHGVTDEHRDVLAPVVHRDRVADHVGHDHGATRPRPDDVAAAPLVLEVHLLHEVAVHEGALLQAARHLFLLVISGSWRRSRHTRSVRQAAAWRRSRRARSIPSALAGLAAADDLGIGGLAGPGAALGLAPRGHRVPTAGGLALTAAVRVVDGVHHDTADGGALALPPHATGLAPVDVRLLGVADLTDRGAAADVDVPHLPGRHPQRGAGALAGDQLRGDAGGPGDLRPAARAHLDAVDGRADRD